MLPNTFEELNRVRCFNHTTQLSAKALLKPFSSAGSTETYNGTEYGDNGMPELQVMDDEDDKEEEGEDDPDADDEDEEEEEDLFTDLDNDEREELINNTEAVCMMLNKVRLNVSIISLPLHSFPLLL